MNHGLRVRERALQPRWLRAAFLGAWLGAVCLGAQAFDLQAHRGARGLMPENTLAAFDRALEIGVDTLELDIAITADGVPVISHDAVLNPDLTRDAQGRWLQGRNQPIHGLTLAQLQAFDVGRIRPGSDYARQFPQQQARDGEKIPALAALFARVRERGADRIRFNIETKIAPDHPNDTPGPAAFAEALLRVLVAWDMVDRTTVQSFDWRTLQWLQQRAPSLATAYLSTDSARFSNVRDPAWTAGLQLREHASVAHMVRAAGGRIWSPQFNQLGAAEVRAAQALGLRVIPWTVNAPQDMDRLIHWGVDGLITDYPDRLRDALQRAGLPLPHALGKAG